MSQNRTSGVILWAVPRFHRADARMAASAPRDDKAAPIDALQEALVPTLTEPSAHQAAPAPHAAL